MKVIDPGHTYIPDYLDNEQEVEQLPIQFVKRIGEKFPGNEGEPKPGTTCQEVLRILIDRVHYLENQIPCEENIQILHHLRWSIHYFEQRAARRHGLNYTRHDYVENIPTCPNCGHIFGCNCEIYND